jgi:hypothetical protein
MPNSISDSNENRCREQCPQMVSPVCAGQLDDELAFHPVVYHLHPSHEGHTHCPIRVYPSWREVDGRFDGQLVTNLTELIAVFHALPGTVRGRVRVVMPVVLAKQIYSFTDADFALDKPEAAA